MQPMDKSQWIARCIAHNGNINFCNDSRCLNHFSIEAISQKWHHFCSPEQKLNQHCAEVPQGSVLGPLKFLFPLLRRLAVCRETFNGGVIYYIIFACGSSGQRLLAIGYGCSYRNIFRSPLGSQNRHIKLIVTGH